MQVYLNKILFIGYGWKEEIATSPTGFEFENIGEKKAIRMK